MLSPQIIGLKEEKGERGGFRSGVFIANFEHISHLVLVFLLLTLKVNSAG